ncbi:MAG TPA: NBR1-Ig-like domain-containing protein [Anaerolineae bacterium]|nr:NBR1-Ig-like domain-containing protein [Anaerolineae bacterium]HQH38221.1 NBR1-Ig-like domain-containing protein [Anaerolineae bacterium]
MKVRNQFAIVAVIVLLLVTLACKSVAPRAVATTPQEAGGTAPVTTLPSATLDVATTPQEAGGAATATTPPSATNPPATAVPAVTAEGGCTLNAGWVADVTVPDDTQFAPGSAFVKTWRIRNSGTCTWEAGSKLLFVSGDPLGGPASVDVPAVAPGANTDVSVNFVTPGAPGTYRSNWQMQNPEGTRYGSQIYVQIVVPAPPTVTPVPPTVTPTAVPTAVPTPFGGGIGKIAYVSFRDGNAEIYVMSDNDAAPTRLTNNPETDDWPDWSPDGKRIAFTRYTGGKPDVYVMNADGTMQTNVTSNPAWDSVPAWSPDGTRIAFDSDRTGGAQIWVMKADGTGLLQLTNTPQLNHSPDWSPDGNRITFESERDGQREIYVMNADGTAPTRLTFSGNNYGPEWSPGGDRIVFSSSNGLWSVKPDGTQLTQLTVNAGPLILDMHPHWSPDGSRILFDTKRSGNQDLYVINADGTGMQQLTTNAAADLNSTWR